MRISFLTATLFISILSVFSQEIQRTIDEKNAKLEFTKQGKEILVDAYIPRGITEFELRIESDFLSSIDAEIEYLADNETFVTGFDDNVLPFPVSEFQYPAIPRDSIMLGGKWVRIYKKKYEPTLRDVEYGPYERNKLDFWKAESQTPTPLVFYIHGGGWGGGSKEENKGPHLNLLKNGVSYVSINYRLARGENKLPCSLLDAARALQFVRSKAKEWNIDPERIIATGGSAGGCSSLWLACHDDLANPKSDDTIERESTRLLAAAVISAQTTIDALLIQQRIGTSATNHSMIWKSVGATSPDDLFNNWENYKDLALECSPLTHLSKEDPPVYLTYSYDAPNPVTRNGIHHAEFGRIFKKAADSIGVDCIFDTQSQKIRQMELDKFMLRIFDDTEGE